MVENVYTPIIKVSVDSETGAKPDGKWPPAFKFKTNKTVNSLVMYLIHPKINLMWIMLP